MHEKIKNITNIKSKRKEYEKKLNPKITVIVHGILGILDYYDKYDKKNDDKVDVWSRTKN